MTSSHSRGLRFGAAVLAGAVLLAGCGRDDEEPEETQPVTTTTTTSKVSAPPSPALSSSDQAPSEQPAPAPAPAAGPAAPPPAADMPSDPAEVLPDAMLGGPVQRPDVAAVQGQPASPEDEGALRELVQGYYKFGPDARVQDLTTYMVDNSCAALAEKNGGRQGYDAVPFPDIKLSQWPGYAPNATADISQVMVDGDVASAVSTVRVPGKPEDVQTMRFARENGRWTFCDR